MKKIFYILSALVFLASCATSQSAMRTEAKNKVQQLKPILNLSDSQAKKMTGIELDFLKNEKKIHNHTNYNALQKELNDNRVNAIKKILNYDQFLKFDALEGGRIKNVPVRAG